FLRRDTAHQRPCQMPAGGGGHLVPPGLEVPLDPLDLGVKAASPTDPALVAFAGPGARHPSSAGRADRWADPDRVGEAGDPEFLEVEAPSLVTPGHGHHIARDECPRDVPEPLGGLVGHAANLSAAVRKKERD